MFYKTLFRFGCHAKPLLNAAHNLLQMRLSDSVKHLSPILFARQKSAPLHQTQMFRRHCTWQTTRFRKFPNGKIPLQQHLNHTQPMRMSQRPQTLGRFAQSFQFSQFQL